MSAKSRLKVGAENRRFSYIVWWQKKLSYRQVSRYGVFLLPEKYILFERFQKILLVKIPRKKLLKNVNIFNLKNVKLIM